MTEARDKLLSQPLLRKYIAYARQYVVPVRGWAVLHWSDVNCDLLCRSRAGLAF